MLGAVVHPAQRVVVDERAGDAAVGGEDAGLGLDLLGSVDAAHRTLAGEQRVAVEELEVAGELLDAVDLAAALDLDRDGQPVGMSAASDEPRLAAARVGTVSAIGYIAFLAGPPLLGLLGDLIGLRLALLAVLAFVLLSLLTSHVARERTAPGPAGASVTKEAS